MGSGLKRIAVAAAAGLALAMPAAGDDLMLATTTSVRDSGLMEQLIPEFEKQTGIHVKLLAVGSGAALRMGSKGDVDVLVTHAPPAEVELVESGAALERRPFMENHFAIAGPPADPAQVAQATDGADAFRRLSAAKAKYVSRDDDSGTHRRERALLKAAGIGPDRHWPGFARSGAGMGITLQIAGERRAYALSDIGTLLAFQERTDLVPLGPATDDLRNVYSVLRINPERFPGRIRAKAAERFARFLETRGAQERIARFGVEHFGRPLFRPLLLPVAGR